MHELIKRDETWGRRKKVCEKAFPASRASISYTWFWGELYNIAQTNELNLSRMTKQGWKTFRVHFSLCVVPWNGGTEWSWLPTPRLHDADVERAKNTARKTHPTGCEDSQPTPQKLEHLRISRAGNQINWYPREREHANTRSSQEQDETCKRAFYMHDWPVIDHGDQGHNIHTAGEIR
jgi:hypothetical protein